jgi:two-component system, OmpR family, manganese sensing sensor histidine kinase
MFQSLRYRLLFSYIVVMGTTLSIFCTGVYIFYTRSLYGQLDKRLQTLAQAAAPSLNEVKTKGGKYLDQVNEVPWRDIFNIDEQSLEWFNEKGQLLGRKGSIQLEGLPTPGSLKQKPKKVSIKSHTISVFIRDRSTPGKKASITGFIRASQSTSEVEAIQNQLLWVLTIGGLMTLVLIGVGGYWLTQKAIEPIEKSFEKLKQFTADASHELRGPLTAIKASVDVMQNHPERIHPKDVKKMSAIASATSQMSQLIQDLLFLARTDDTVHTPPRQSLPIPLKNVLQDIANFLEPFAQEKKVALKLDLYSDVSVFGDKGQITRLLSNLIQNALQYTPEDGTVAVSLVQQNRMAIVSIKDTGIGIPSEQLPYIFDRFWRADKARSRREGGTGLGLAIASAIAQSHGGKITVTSKENAGSCFQIKLPILL